VCRELRTYLEAADVKHAVSRVAGKIDLAVYCTSTVRTTARRGEQ
jgi:hypothetical protein